MTFSKKIRLLSLSIGIIYFYFGILKFFPNASPAEEIGMLTINQLCFGMLSPIVCISALALLEVGIGLSLIFNKFLKIGVSIAIIHLVLTFSPVIFFPEQTFNHSILSPSLLGQYIFKNIVLICALIVIYPEKQLRPSLSFK